MAGLFGKIKTNYKHLGTIMLFVAAFFLIALMIPRERKFTYEFSIGKPWEHDHLNAPFDFPILKTDEEIREEEDTVRTQLKLYFTFDANRFAEQLNSFKENFANEWVKYSMNEYKIADMEKYLQSGRYFTLRELQNKFDNYIYSLLEKVYFQGVAELPENFANLEPTTYIVLVRGNIAENKQLSELYTPKSAYEFIRTKIQDEIKSTTNNQITRYSKFLNEYEIDRYIIPNVFYDAAGTERERATMMQQISLTKGKIQNGELIISNGEIITQEKYQILLSLKKVYAQEDSNVNSFVVLAGKLIFVILSLVLIYSFLYNFRKELINDIVKSAFILFMVVLMVFVANTTARLNTVSFYIIPFTILPIILRTFFDERVAVFVHVITVMLLSMIAPRAYEFIVLNIFAGIVAIFSLTNLYRRSRFFLSALLVIITYSLVYTGLSVMHEGSFVHVNIREFANFGINGVMILISFLLIYIFEKTFGFLSDTTLMELADTNQPLLRKLAEIAPGTFQHSLQVANLSEEAIYRIGGNPLLVRTGALYHDIGKMYDPIYFIENQTTGINPHDNLEFEDSAKAIINHVVKGVELARKNKLPEAIIDFIRTHHGNTTVQYFYRSYIKKYPDQEVDAGKFTYPGPRPSSKEMAVLMMADSVEAASRSLSEINEETIGDLVEKIINAQLSSGQYEIAPVTFSDITTVKEVFKIRLRNIYHARISYPTR
jgi:cyclic-di-AMP phosphodiesterase PgpH